jgi:hypothetical protein
MLTGVRAPRANPVPINKLASGQKLRVASQSGLAALADGDIASIAQAFACNDADRTTTINRIKGVFAIVNDVCFNILDGPSSWRVDAGRNYQEVHVTDIDIAFPGLDEQDARKLEKAMRIAHMHIAMDRTVTPSSVAIWFRGTTNARDVVEDMRTMCGTYGPLFKSARDAAEVMSRLLTRDAGLRCHFVGGYSLGGGVAQCFVAALGAATPPAMVLFDPQLLNNRQAAFALKGGNIYDFSHPRGVAITLYSDVKPRKGVMGIMKAMAGYTYPGLVELKLETLGGDDSATNALAPVAHPGGIASAPKPSLLLGYHKQKQLFKMAIQRLLNNGATAATAAAPPPAIPAPPDPVLTHRPAVRSDDPLDDYMIYAKALDLNE